MNYAIIDKETLQILNVYFSENGPDPSRINDSQVQIEVPSNLDYFYIKAQDLNTIVEDPIKIQIKIQAKIDANKAFRDMCLQKTDFTRLDDVGLTNVDEWKEFRATLRSLDMTPPVSWPTEPSSPWGSFLPTPPEQ